MVESREMPTIHSFKQILIDSVHSPNIAIDECIQSIDLEKIGTEASDLYQRSINDSPIFRERGKTIYVTPDKKVIFPIEDTVGTNSEICVPVFFK